MNESRKYCRSLHAQISLGTTSDDRFMPNGYIKAFAKMDPNKTGRINVSQFAKGFGVTESKDVQHLFDLLDNE